MKTLTPLFITLIFLLSSAMFTGCSVVEGIFKAGVWVGVLIVVGIIALIVFIIGKASKK